MNLIGKIACRTIGLASMSAIVYDAYCIGKHHSKAGAAEASADVFEKAIAAKRTTDTESYITGAMQNKVADLRMNNPIISAFGRVKGFFKGTLNSLGNNIIPVSFASMALVGKNKTAKFGAWGTLGYAAFLVLKEGFGLGKHTPVD